MEAILNKLKAVLAYLPSSVRTFVVHMLTGADNKTFDVSRFLLLASGLTFLGIAVYHVIATKTWDAVSFGAGAGGLLGGGAAGVRIKASTEPGAGGQ